MKITILIEDQELVVNVPEKNLPLNRERWDSISAIIFYTLRTNAAFKEYVKDINTTFCEQ